MISIKYKKNDNQFKLVIYCEDYQNEECYDEFPTLQDLQYIWQDYMLGIIFTILI